MARKSPAQLESVADLAAAAAVDTLSPKEPWVAAATAAGSAAE